MNLSKLLCRFNYHHYILTKDSGVYWYFRCKRCEKTKYQKVMAGYQPLDYSLLNNREVSIEDLVLSMEKLLEALDKGGNKMDERKVLNELEKTYNSITDISRNLGDLRVFEKLCPNTLIDKILVTISNMNDRLKFIHEQINRLDEIK